MTSPYLEQPLRTEAEVIALRQTQPKPVLDRDTPERFAARTRHLRVNGQHFTSLWAEMFGWPT